MIKKQRRFCHGCGIELKVRYKIKYCSNKCQCNSVRRNFISDWKKGMKDGSIGITTRTISGYIKRYLYEQAKGRCSRCGWSETNPFINKVPLEIDHIDGNSENNSMFNLRLICPNCHSLTPNYKALNWGKGRKWRMNKYIKNEPRYRPKRTSLI